MVLALNFCKAQNVGEAKSSGGFCVMSYNVRNCKGMDDVVDYARVAAVISSTEVSAASMLRAIVRSASLSRRSTRLDA
mgnify:CR=1 FL=1